MADPRTPQVEGPEDEEVSTYDKLVRRQAQRDRDTKFITQAAERRTEVLEAEKQVQEQRRNLALDTGYGVVRGPAAAFSEALKMVGSVDEWLMERAGAIDLNPLDNTGKGLYVSPSEYAELKEGEGNSVLTTGGEGWAMIRDLVPEPERVPGQIAEPMAQFLTGFLLTRRGFAQNNVLQGTGLGAQFVNATAAGAVADFTVFDPHMERLSNLVESFPALQNPVTAYLATDIDGDTSELEERIKATLEGAAIGALLEPFMLALRGMKRAAFAKEVEQAVEEVDNLDMKFESLEAEDAVAKLDDLEVEDARFGEADELDIDGNSTLITARRAELRGDDTELDVALGPDEAGKIELMERGGETLQVINSAVEAESRGTGMGRRLYDRAIAIADERGLRFTSDTSVSKSAAALWERLKRDGHEIIDRRKEAELVDGQWQTRNGQPVFERVRGPETAAEKSVKTVDDGLQGKRDMQHDIVVAMRDEVELRHKEGRATKTAERNLKTAENRLKKYDAELESRKIEAEENRRIEAGEADPEEVRHIELRQSARAAAVVPERLRAAFLKAVQEGDEAGAHRLLQDFNEARYDFDSIENGADIKNILLETERMFAAMIDEVKGGIQSNKRTVLLGNMVGATGDSVNQLFKDVRGDHGIAARFYAASRVMLASAENVRKKAALAYKEPGNSKAQAEAMQAVQTHAAIQAQVKGAQTEIARALQAMSVIKEDMASGFREFDELRRNFGPRGGGGTAWEKYMDELAFKSEGLADLNARMKWTRGERYKNIFIEWTINAMLSSAKTHVINFTSNVLNTVIYSFDRTMAGAWRYMRHGDRAAMREVQLDWMGKYHSLGEAWKLAKQAFRDGAPVTDKRQRIEFLTRQAIGSDATDANYFRSIANKFRNPDSQVANDGTFFQKAVNTLGHTVRVPGRLLITGDEYFKAIQRNAEISVLSFRQADEEATRKGLEYGTDAYETFVSSRVKKLSDTSIRDPENLKIQTQAVEKSRLVTFQEAPRTDLGAGSERLMNSNWMIKLVLAPFFRTPMNILRQGVLDRTPLGWSVKHHRDAIARGGREAAEVQARMASGVAAMTVFYGLTSSGEDGDLGFEVLGKQPWDSSTRTSGIPDYSIRIGDTWYQYNRLEPTGMWLGFISDMRTMFKYRQDPDAAMQVWQFALFSFLNNVTDKTYMRSLSDLQDMLEGVASGREQTAQRAIDRFAAGEFGKLIPQLYKGAARATEGDGESFRKEVWDFWDIVADRSTTYSKDLAPKHDILGRPIERDAGLSALINPFANMQHSDDPVDQEMFRLGFSVQPMRKTLGAEQVDLTSEEYSKMTGFMGTPLNVHAQLTQLVESDSYETLTDEMKKVLFKQIITENRAAARAMILADPSITQRVVDSTVEAALKLSGEE
jgi:predicted GNAT family acetyltransferase